MSDTPTPQETIIAIAHIAANFGALANVGGCETAGLIVSYLAANPERIKAFLEDGCISHMHWRDGCLTWHGKDGKIHAPADLGRVEQ